MDCVDNVHVARPYLLNGYLTARVEVSGAKDLPERSRSDYFSQLIAILQNLSNNVGLIRLWDLRHLLLKFVQRNLVGFLTLHPIPSREFRRELSLR